MALAHDEMHQIKELFTQIQTLFADQAKYFDDKFDTQRTTIMADLRIVLNVELHDVKEKLSHLVKMESEDIGAAYVEIENLKKRIAKLEKQVGSLK